MKQKKDHQLIGCIAGCAMILSASSLSGQQQDTTRVVALDEVVVTATSSEKKLNDIGRSITVITSNVIKNSGAITISELLNQEEGLYIVGAQQNPGSLSSVFTRGANSNHTVIMIDGIQMTDPASTDNSINLAELSLSDVERIEIVRGSHSTLYGSSAIGGVINIITTKNNLTPGIHIDTDVKGGVFSKSGSIRSENLFLNYTHRSGLYVNAEVFNSLSKGFNSTIDTVTNPNTYKNPDMSDGFKTTDMIGKVGYKTKKFDLYAGYKNVSQNLDIDDGAFKDDENYKTNLNRNLITYGVSYKINENFSAGMNGGISEIVRRAVDDSSTIDAPGATDKSYFRARYSGKLNNNGLQANYTPKGLQLVTGAGINKESMSSQTYYFSNQWGTYISETNLDTLKIHTVTSNLFLHVDLNGELLKNSFKPFSIVLGARYINHSTFGSTLTYEITPSIKLNENSLLYFSYSTGFNAPSLYQLYSPDKDYNSGITRGNITLKPEESRSLEIGIKQQVNNNLWWSASFFKTVVENIVDYVYLWDGTKEISSLTYIDYRGDTYINLGRQTNKGIEFSINSKLSDKITVSGNFSLVSGALEFNPENIDMAHTKGNHIQLFSNGEFINKEVKSIGLVQRPNTANINIEYLPFNELAIRFDLIYVGPRYDVYYNSSLGPFGSLGNAGVEDYTLMNFSANYKIIKGLSAMVRVENILNTEYYEIIGYATRGRGIYCGIRYSF